MGKARSNQRSAKSEQSDRPLVLEPGSSLDDGERRSQVTLQMRQSLHRELSRRAFESGMTMRGFIMQALQRMGLDITDDDLVDKRRRG